MLIAMTRVRRKTQSAWSKLTTVGAVGGIFPTIDFAPILAVRTLFGLDIQPLSKAAHVFNTAAIGLSSWIRGLQAGRMTTIATLTMWTMAITCLTRDTRELDSQ
jgi:hypothetical protein